MGYNGTSGTWGVTQRYVYSPYGTITVLNADWSVPAAGTNPIVNNLYQGMTLDSVTGLYYSRNRNYSPSLGTWISQDPLQYINGANTYQFVMGNPIGNVDPQGLDTSGLLPAGSSGTIANVPSVPTFGQVALQTIGTAICKAENELGNLWQDLNNLSRSSPIGVGIGFNVGVVKLEDTTGAGQGVQLQIGAKIGPIGTEANYHASNGQWTSGVSVGNEKFGVNNDNTLTFPLGAGSVSVNAPMLMTDIANNPPGMVTDVNGNPQVVPP